MLHVTHLSKREGAKRASLGTESSSGCCPEWSSRRLLEATGGAAKDCDLYTSCTPLSAAIQVAVSGRVIGDYAYRGAGLQTLLLLFSPFCSILGSVLLLFPQRLIYLPDGPFNLSAELRDLQALGNLGVAVARQNELLLGSRIILNLGDRDKAEVWSIRRYFVVQILYCGR